MRGNASFSFMSRLPMPRHFFTAATRFCKPSDLCTSWSTAAFERNVRLVENGARPKLPNMGLVKTGCGVGIDALGSPMAADMGKPPFRTISGFTPKKAGFHSTRSANLPTSTEPTSCAMPCAIAGLIVYFDR